MSENRFLFTFTWPGEPPTIQAVCTKFGFAPEELDVEFGIIDIDPDIALYTILLDMAAYKRLKDQPESDELDGPYSNPPIAPFGPPEA